MFVDAYTMKWLHSVRLLELSMELKGTVSRIQPSSSCSDKIQSPTTGGSKLRDAPTTNCPAHPSLHANFASFDRLSLEARTACGIFKSYL